MKSIKKLYEAITTKEMFKLAFETHAFIMPATGEFKSWIKKTFPKIPQTNGTPQPKKDVSTKPDPKLDKDEEWIEFYTDNNIPVSWTHMRVPVDYKPIQSPYEWSVQTVDSIDDIDDFDDEE